MSEGPTGLASRTAGLRELHGGRNQDTNRRCASRPPRGCRQRAPPTLTGPPLPKVPWFGHLGTWVMYSPSLSQAPSGIFCNLCTHSAFTTNPEEREDSIATVIAGIGHGRAGQRTAAPLQGLGRRSAVWLPLLKGD